MDVEREGEGRLRIGPWVPDPLEARRSSGFAAHGTESAADAGSADPWTDAPLAASADESGGRRRRRRRGAAPVRGRWLVLAVAVIGLGAAVGVPLLRLSQPPRPGATAPPATGGPPAVGPASPSADAGVSGLSTAPWTASPSPSASRPATAMPAPRPAPVTYEAEDPGN